MMLIYLAEFNMEVKLKNREKVNVRYFLYLTFFLINGVNNIGKMSISRRKL